MFQLAEYGAMLLNSTMVALLFLGGWLSPVGFLPNSVFWLIAKICVAGLLLLDSGDFPTLPV